LSNTGKAKITANAVSVSLSQSNNKHPVMAVSEYLKVKPRMAKTRQVCKMFHNRIMME